MKIKIGNTRKIFYFKYERVNGEVELLWKIENSTKRWLWLHYSNSKRDKRIWEIFKKQFVFSKPNGWWFFSEFSWWSKNKK